MKTTKCLIGLTILLTTVCIGQSIVITNLMTPRDLWTVESRKHDYSHLQLWEINQWQKHKLDGYVEIVTTAEPIVTYIPPDDYYHPNIWVVSLRDNLNAPHVMDYMPNPPNSVTIQNGKVIRNSLNADDGSEQSKTTRALIKSFTNSGDQKP